MGVQKLRSGMVWVNLKSYETNNCFVTSYKKHTKNNIVKSRLHEIKYQMIYEIDLPLQVPAAASREDISSKDLSNPQPLVKKHAMLRHQGMLMRDIICS